MGKSSQDFIYYFINFSFNITDNTNEESTCLHHQMPRKQGKGASLSEVKRLKITQPLATLVWWNFDVTHGSAAKIIAITVRKEERRKPITKRGRKEIITEESDKETS